MTIFEQLHPREDFKSPQEIVVLERRLDQLIKDGFDKRTSSGRTRRI